MGDHAGILVAAVLFFARWHGHHVTAPCAPPHRAAKLALAVATMDLTNLRESLDHTEQPNDAARRTLEERLTKEFRGACAGGARWTFVLADVLQWRRSR